MTVFGVFTIELHLPCLFCVRKMFHSTLIKMRLDSFQMSASSEARRRCAGKLAGGGAQQNHRFRVIKTFRTPKVCGDGVSSHTFGVRFIFAVLFRWFRCAPPPANFLASLRDAAWSPTTENCFKFTAGIKLFFDSFFKTSCLWNLLKFSKRVFSQTFIKLSFHPLDHFFDLNLQRGVCL
jgi:hypothetical protein